MTDAFGRPITYLRLSVTDLCDLRCTYCMPPEGVCKRAHGEICSLEELAELAAAFVELGIRKIRLTGGEPLVRRGIVSLVEKLNALRPLGLEELCMTTNGQRLAEFAGPLRAAGLDRLNVSLDSLRPERYRALTRGGILDRVLDGVAAAEAAGFDRISLNAVLLKGVNDDELRDLALLAKDRPRSVRFIELMPIGPGAGLEFLPAEAVLEAVPELREMQNAKCKMQNEPASVGAVIGRPPEADSCRDGTLPSAPPQAEKYAAIGDGGTGKAFPLGEELSGGERDFMTICAAELRKWYPTLNRWHPASPASRMTDEGLSDRGTRNQDPSSVARLYTAAGWAGTVGLIAPMSACFCETCSRVRLTADGKLKLCLHSAEEYPLRGLRGDELKAAILSAIQKKPARHRLPDTKKSESIRPMNEIGG